MPSPFRANFNFSRFLAKFQIIANGKQRRISQKSPVQAGKIYSPPWKLRLTRCQALWKRKWTYFPYAHGASLGGASDDHILQVLVLQYTKKWSNRCLIQHLGFVREWHKFLFLSIRVKPLMQYQNMKTSMCSKPECQHFVNRSTLVPDNFAEWFSRFSEAPIVRTLFLQQVLITVS